MGVVPARGRRTRSLGRNNNVVDVEGSGRRTARSGARTRPRPSAAGLTGQNLVTPVCWRFGSAAQLAACAWDHRVRACCENRSAASARPRSKGAEGGLEQLGVPGGEVGGCFPDQAGELAAARQPMQGSWCSRRRPPSARHRGRPGRSSCRTARRRRCAPGRAQAGPGPRSSAARRPARHRRCRWLSSRSLPGLQDVPGHRQSAASQSASRSITRWRMCGEGGISGLGGCKIGSRPGPVQAGNAGPRSP